jgi:hypothetical protein
MDPKDRREVPRFEGEFRVDLLNMGDDPAFPPHEAVISSIALDVSKKGIRLRSAYNVSVGSLISSIVYYKNADSIALCEVIWKREDQNGFLYGLFINEWSSINPALLQQLNTLENEPQRSFPDLSPKAQFA